MIEDQNKKKKKKKIRAITGAVLAIIGLASGTIIPIILILKN